MASFRSCVRFLSGFSCRRGSLTFCIPEISEKGSRDEARGGENSRRPKSSRDGNNIRERLRNMAEPFASYFAEALVVAQLVHQLEARNRDQPVVPHAQPEDGIALA